MKGMALYKAAGTDTVLKIAGRVVPYEKGMTGFFINAFNGLRLIILNEKDDKDCVWMGEEKSTEYVTEEEYKEVFRTFHERLTDGSFRKLVLSRRRWEKGTVDVLESFRKACEIYKDQTVVLFSSEMTGTWLTATPELLLRMENGKGFTMALAGTMREGEGEWSEKNREEQRIVADYIGDTLRKCCDSVEEEKPRTVKAGELLHLRSLFNFTSKEAWVEIAGRLHPTPAVCGLPTEKARGFINDHEGYKRELYSGFCGPVAGEKECLLHVILRCMQISSNGYWLYAGGGLLAESEAESEWRETENKMETIKKCIVTK